MTEQPHLRPGELSPEAREGFARTRLVAFDFDGVFTDNGVWVLEDGTEAVRCSRSDGLGLARLKALGLPCVVVSSEPNVVVATRCRKLELPCEHGCEDKAGVLARMAGERGVSLDRVAFVGNDVNDVDCLRSVGLPIAVRDAWSEVLDVAAYRTARRGGHGAVREVCDRFAQILGERG